MRSVGASAKMMAFVSRSSASCAPHGGANVSAALRFRTGLHMLSAAPPGIKVGKVKKALALQLLGGTKAHVELC